jgi:hypothetical protein
VKEIMRKDLMQIIQIRIEEQDVVILKNPLRT